jgi:hypothetical protein
MNKGIKWIFGMVLLMGHTGDVLSQLKSRDSLSALHEFAKLGQLYKHPPVRLNIHLQNSASPVTTASDTMQADMDLYYGSGEFYMQAEGLEEIVNDSMVIAVNSQTKQIVMYTNSQQVVKSIDQSVSLFMPDSSLEILSKKYRSAIAEAGPGKKKIALKSRETLYGTLIPKESAEVIYRASSYEPDEFIQTKVRLVPVDSVVYHELEKDSAYLGKLVSTPSAGGNLFFLVKEVNTSCSFRKIDHQVQGPPVGERDRVVKTPNGAYTPAKGFEEYVLSKSF